MAISQSFLIEKALHFNKSINEVRSIRASLGKMKSAFLCHSHKDEILVKGLIRTFEDSGIELYVDWQDHTMPETPDETTARKIQEKIKECDVLLFLATANSKASRWCPWEIGYGDSSGRHIYIIPTTDGYNEYGNEYLSLYSKIDIGTTEIKKSLAVFEVGHGKGKWLSEAAL